MRFTRDARKCVVYLGYPDGAAGPHGIVCEGTGFLVLYQGGFYLVTAGHVAKNLGETGFTTRVNKKDGTSANVDAPEKVRWFFHPQYPNVDIAIVPFAISAADGFDFLYMDARQLFLTVDQENPDHVEIGDLCYTVGLFRVLAGEGRNLPVVHTGHIARLPGEELIPIRDRAMPAGKVMVDGYLVEAQTLSGLSGAPVFIRESIRIGLPAARDVTPDVNERVDIVAYREKVSLLGLWQAAWEAPAGEVVTLDRNRQMTVPVGMGVVVPASKIVEVLEMPAVKNHRQDYVKNIELTNAASMQSVSSERGSKDSVGEAAVAPDNPSHKEDFTRLLGAAAKSNK